MNTQNANQAGADRPRLLRPAEVAKIYGVTTQTLGTWRRSTPRRGPAFVKLGGRIVYPEAGVYALLEEVHS